LSNDVDALQLRR